MEHNLGNNVYGIDVSEEAVRTATDLNQEYINSGKVVLSIGDIADLSFEDDYFDLIVTVQSHIYWDDLERGLSESHRTLNNNGTLLITCEKDKIDYHLSSYQYPEDFSSLLSDIGFRNVKIVDQDNYISFIGTK